MFSKFDIQKLQDIPIEQVAEALNISVSRHKALCPFHEDSRPSLTFNVRKNRYRCFVCDASGSPIDLVMKSQGWNFYESCKWLAKEFGETTSEDLSYFEAKKLATRYTLHAKHLPPSPQPIDTRYLEELMKNPFINDEAQRFLYDERKISPEVVHQLGISSISRPVPMSGNPNDCWFNAPSLMIPYRDTDGRLLSVQARYLGKKAETSHLNIPRFQFPRGSRCAIFNLPVLKTLQPTEPLWITEGVTDCLAMMSSGRKAIAIPSATLLSDSDKQQLSTLSSMLSTEFHMIPDNDAAGERLFLKLQSLLPSVEHHLLPSQFKDFGEYWRREES